MPTDLPVNPDDSRATSLSLLERLGTNDAGAWSRLVELYTPLVLQWCRRWKLQEADLDDVVQELFLAVSRRIEDFKPSPGGSFRGWLRTIVSRKVCDHWRRREVGEGGSDAQERFEALAAECPPAALPEKSPEDDFDDEGILYRRAVDLVLRDFEERTGRAFWMVVIDGRSPAEVANELGITANAVYLAKGRVLARLRQEFGGLIE